MTEQNQKARDAFEEWYFPYREECWQKNILLDDNDANSMWTGWQAAQEHTPEPVQAVDLDIPPHVLDEAIKGMEEHDDLDPFHSPLAMFRSRVLKAAKHLASRGLIGAQNKKPEDGGV